MKYDQGQLYGDCTNRPTKVTARSEKTCGVNGKGDWIRPKDPAHFRQDWYDAFWEGIEEKRKRTKFRERREYKI
jgi:hypothetical protein